MIRVRRLFLNVQLNVASSSSLTYQGVNRAAGGSVESLFFDS